MLLTITSVFRKKTLVYLLFILVLLPFKYKLALIKTLIDRRVFEMM